MLRAVEPIVDVISGASFGMFGCIPGCFPERKISASCYIASRIQVEEALRKVCAIHLYEALFCWTLS